MEFRLLGDIEVRVGDRSLDVGTPRQQTVLAALVVDAGRPVAMDTLIDRVWDDAPPAEPRNAVYSHLSRIRRLLRDTGARLERRHAGYLLAVDRGEVDVHRFQLLAEGDPGTESARVASLTEALRLWRGTPLAGLPGGWAEQVRSNFHRRRLDVVVRWAEGKLRLGYPAAVVLALHELVDEYPLVEALEVILMRALHAAGRAAEAIDRYAIVRKRLADELGADPGAELSALHQGILRGAPASGSARPDSVLPHEISADSSEFTGRAEQVMALDQLLARATEQSTSTAVASVMRELPLFGRGRELRLVLEHAARTGAGVVGIGGPVGIGKSRLAGEIVQRLRDDGFLVVRGSGGPLHRDLSYAPFVAALRPLVSDARMVRGLGDLGRLFDGLPVPRTEPLSDRRLERTRLFEAMCTLLRRVSAPLVVHLDDLHWVDSDSLALLHYLVRGLADRPVLFLLAYRDGECTPDAAALLNTLRHADQLTETTLSPLDATAVRELVSAVLEDEPPAALLELLPDRAAGVPLFVRALVDGLRKEGALTRSGGRWVLRGGAIGQVPDLVADLVRAQIEALDEPARVVFDAIAVAGGQLTHGMLAGSVSDGSALLDGVRRLRRAGLVEEDVVGGTVSYRAAYRLLSEVAYGLIPAAVRGERHAAAARAVARTAPADLRTLAFHIRSAGDAVPAGQAFDVLSEAARAAFAARRGEEAAANARAAIHAADRQGVGAGTELHALLAEACELAARTDDARVAWLAAADLTDAPPAARSGFLVHAAMAEWDLGRPDAADKCLDRAAACLAGEPPGPAHLALTTTRMRLAGRRSETAVLGALLDDLDGLIAATGSERAKVTRAGCQVVHDLHAGRYDAAVAGMEAAVEAAERFGDPLLTEWVHRAMIVLMLVRGDLAAARRHAHAALACTEAAGLPALGAAHRVLLGWVDFVNGRWDEALVASFEGIELAARLGSPRHVALALALQGLVLTRRGRFAEAMSRAAEAKDRFGPWSAADRHVFSFVDQIEVEVALGRGDPAGAARLAAVLADRHPAFPPLALSVLGDAAVQAGDEATARMAADRLDVLGTPYPRALAQWLRGRLDRDPALLTDAAKVLGVSGMVYEEAVALVDRAELCVADAAELDACVRLLDRLGASPLADRARGLLRALGERPPVRVPQGRVLELSGREEQVARLVAEGLSNAEVAARLSISPRTVTTHLQNMYGRLGFGSRTALARYVIEHAPAKT